MFLKIGVPRNFANFTGKQQCWSLFLYKMVGLEACNLISLQHWWFLVKFPKFLRKPFLNRTTLEAPSVHSIFCDIAPKLHRKLGPACFSCRIFEGLNTDLKTVTFFFSLKVTSPGHWRRFSVFIVNFGHISDLYLVFLLLTLNKYMLAGSLSWYIKIATTFWKS